VGSAGQTPGLHGAFNTKRDNFEKNRTSTFGECAVPRFLDNCRN